MYDLVIIGGGPAGITAGIYAARQKLNVFLITKDFGGQIARKAVSIENYSGFEEISGLDLISKFEKHLRKYEIAIKKDQVRKIKKNGDKFSIQTADKSVFEAKSVIVASGADPRPLEVPGEKEFIGRGISYCVTCDAPLYANKEVAIVGGGNSAFETAVFLAAWVKKIYILEYGEKVRADIENQKKVEKTKKAEVITNVQPKEIKGEKFVSSLIYLDRKTGAEKNLAINGIFIEIGYQPATSFVKELVDFNEKDEIMINPKTMQTKTPGLFAAGDVSDVVHKQIVIAAGEGAKAAISVSNYLQNF